MRTLTLNDQQWEVVYLPKAARDLKKLDTTQARLVTTAISKVQQNPLPYTEGGLGKPLGNRNGTELSGLLKIKLRSSGLRVVYQLRRVNGVMTIVVIGARSDNAVYREAQRRLGNL